jgi:hypothetical protein
MFRFQSSRRSLFRFLGGAIGGFFASRVKADTPVASEPQLPAPPSTQYIFAYDHGPSVKHLSGGVVTFIYDSSRPIRPISITTYTYDCSRSLRSAK